MKTLNKILIGVLGIGVAAVVGLPICAILYMGPPFPWGRKVDSRYDTYYKNHKGIYYISNWNFAMWLNSLHWEYLEDVHEKSFVVIDEDWAKDSSHVWHHDKLIDSADAESFHVNQTGVPADRYNVFKIENWTYVPSKSGIDPATAEYFVYRLGILETWWLRDKQNVYYWDKKIDVDRNTFAVLKTDYFIDKDFIYTPVYDSSDSSHSILAIDSVQFPIDTLSQGSDYIRNGRNVIFRDKVILRDIDFKKFEMVGEDKCVINDMLYYCGEQILKDELNVAEAKFYFYGHIAVDGKNVFYGKKCLPDVDAATFRQIDDDVYEDKDYIYRIKPYRVRTDYPFTKESKHKRGHIFPDRRFCCKKHR